MNLDSYYFILHAYDKLGRRLYGRDWTGQEVWLGDLESPESLEQLRKPHEDALVKLDQRQDELEAKLAATVSQRAIDTINSELENLFRERAE